MFNLLSCFRCSFRKLEAYATTKSTAREADGIPDMDPHGHDKSAQLR
jgi:hypothetical protein